MTQTEMLDRIAQLEGLLKQSEGKAIASARDAAQARREGDKAKAEADAYKGETDLAIAQAAEHLRMGASVALGIYGLGMISRHVLARKALAARIVHRESKMIGLIDDLIGAASKWDRGAVQAAINNARPRVDAHKKNAETLRMEIAEQSLIVAKRDISSVLASAIEGES